MHVVSSYVHKCSTIVDVSTLGSDSIAIGAVLKVKIKLTPCKALHERSACNKQM